MRRVLHHGIEQIEEGYRQIPRFIIQENIKEVQTPIVFPNGRKQRYSTAIPLVSKMVQKPHMETFQEQIKCEANGEEPIDTQLEIYETSLSSLSPCPDSSPDFTDTSDIFDDKPRHTPEPALLNYNRLARLNKMPQKLEQPDRISSPCGNRLLVKSTNRSQLDSNTSYQVPSDVLACRGDRIMDIAQLPKEDGFADDFNASEKYNHLSGLSPQPILEDVTAVRAQHTPTGTILQNGASERTITLRHQSTEEHYNRAGSLNSLSTITETTTPTPTTCTTIDVNINNIQQPLETHKLLLNNQNTQPEQANRAEEVTTNATVRVNANQTAAVRPFVITDSLNSLQRTPESHSLSSVNSGPRVPSLPVRIIYVKPPPLRREHIENPVAIPSSPETLSVCSRPQSSDTSAVHSPKSGRSQGYFLYKPVDQEDLPEAKTAVMNENLGELKSHLKNLVFRLHDSSVIPGGAFRAIMYLTVQETLFVTKLALTVEATSKIVTGKSKDNLDKKSTCSHVCLTSKDSVDTRKPPHRFSYELPEFKTSFNTSVFLDHPCHQPYAGPIELPPGDYAIPCLFPLDPKSHPSITLKHEQPGGMEFSNSYTVSAKIHFKKPDEDDFLSITSRKLLLRVVSCGPLPLQMDNGQAIPAVNQTFSLGDVKLMIQADSLVVQDGYPIHFYVFVNKVGVIKQVQAYLLQIFHIPALGINDEKALYRTKKFPDCVVIRDQTGPVTMEENFSLPFSTEAEAAMQAGYNVSRKSSTDQPAIDVSQMSSENLGQPPIPTAAAVKENLERESRKAGCALTLTVTAPSIPQFSMEDFRVSYYVRILIYIKKRVTAYSIPISVVETRLQDYKMQYLGEKRYLHDKAFLRLNRTGRCAVS
ncbi:unnamed protein product [Calicophoron daubneyi]|uniref:Arrestin C-terminal-like domain-containing protein n=1 Tax=Calicophoron daubneyi TaxID=300641 RepID=A0AAV2TY54_CALDB